MSRVNIHNKQEIVAENELQSLFLLKKSKIWVDSPISFVPLHIENINSNFKGYEDFAH